MRGCRAAEIACAALHFPGLGAASQDTSRGPGDRQPRPGVARGARPEPFEAAFAERAPAVVLSLAFYAAYDPVTPGALAEPVATGLLRDELGFEGVAITDDLGAGAVRRRSLRRRGRGGGARRRRRPGADRLARPIRSASASAILDALDSGELPEERLREAAARVLELSWTRASRTCDHPAT